jgi:hypothetical protein
MRFIQHPTNTRALGAPPDWNVSDANDPRYCGCLPITDVMQDDLHLMASFWKPDAQDLAALNAGKAIVLMIYGQVHPVVALGIER